ncbi:gamma-glutamyltransferase family protein [Pelomonas sp. SE-A7]|uniref:gamma-glutamyltransferase family protein n=1 Tax=Pelomonas sp. SE-A7 TaxID=3054953 RepID=UPI00259CCC45|nr:gamma-glutamyltransferase family protein [Pelomonas sp. SE-A7]MDM4767467.1 gamma-glutamyltransferase family protein [Pelomonas sp. SE-A7]
MTTPTQVMQGFDWKSGYASRRSPLFARNVVATSHPLAAQAGLRMLASGGNAVDAAVAAAACMTVLEPCSNGLGSDAFAIVWDGQRLQGLDAAGVAPAAWTRAQFGDAAKAPPKRGWSSVTVPGAVSSWVALSERYGKLPFGDLMQPAIEIAERGYAVPVIVQRKWQLAAGIGELVGQPGFAETFLPHGRSPAVGERFCMPGAARSLKLIAETRGEAFYRGEIAAALAAFSKATGGQLTAADLAAHQPQWVDTISQAYAGHQLHELPPSGQGIAALIALGLLKHHDLRGLGADSVVAQHLQIEAMKLAFADTYRFVADPLAMELTAAELLDPAYLAERASLIDPRKAQDFGHGNPVRGGTIYLSAADESGMMVSFIQSNFMGFGSGLVLPGYGVSLQNRGHGFSLDPAHPNCVAPGKKPFHTIIPAMLMRDGQAQMSFGVMGGHMQPQGHLQTLVRMLDFHQHPQAACDAPRWRFNEGLSIDVEPEMPAATVQGLRALGHQIGDMHEPSLDLGAGQFIWRLGEPAVEGYVAASDPRRDGAAVGF